MVNEELVDWIKSESAKGYGKHELREIAIQQNFSSNEIDEAFKNVNISEKEVIKMGIKGHIFGIISLVLIGLAPLLGFLLTSIIAGVLIFAVAVVLAIIGAVKEKSWTSYSTITLGVLYISWYLAYLILKSKMANALMAAMSAGMAG